MQKTNRLWITVLALGWVFDFLFWKHTPGVSFAIFVVLTLGTGFWLTRGLGVSAARGTLLLLLPIGLLAAMTFVRAEPMTAFLTHVMTLFLMFVLVVTFSGGRWLSYGLADYVVRLFSLLGSMIARPLGFTAEARRDTPEEETPKARRQVWPVLRGLLMALPVVALLASLLASADLVFAQRLDDFIKLFRLENLPEYIFRGVYILILAYLLAGIYLHAAERSRDEKLQGEEKPVVPPFLGFTEAAIVLGSVILLFAMFVIIQFQYFFGGQANISVEGFTYSEYARRGFGELLGVAFISLLLLMGFSALSKRETPLQRRAFSGLGIGVVALVLVMLVSAYQRLALYEDAYGFSRLRTYSHVFLLWLAALLVAVVALEWIQKQRLFAVSMLITALGFALSLAFLNVDGFIVRQNVARAEAGHELDVAYLASLSEDAVPALAQAFASTRLSAGTREAVGAALACRAARTGSRQPDTSWQSFHVSRWQADQTMASLKSSLSGYKEDDDEWPLILTTPGGVEYDCWKADTFD
ncbi:MAG: DUF4173 domain-containing protein [Chloroflexota bacterium]